MKFEIILLLAVTVLIVAGARQAAEPNSDELDRRIARLEMEEAAHSNAIYSLSQASKDNSAAIMDLAAATRSNTKSIIILSGHDPTRTK